MNIDIEYVRNNPNGKRSRYSLSHNSKLTVKDIETLVLPNSKRDWDWDFISQNIDIQEVRNNPDKPWNKFWLSMNKQLTVKDIDNLVLPKTEGEWNWYYISENINILEVINNPNKPWDREGLEYNIGITDKILEFFNDSLLKHLQKNIYTFRYHTDISVKYEY